MPPTRADVHLINNLRPELPAAIAELPGIRITTVLPGEAVPDGLQADAMITNTLWGDNLEALLASGVEWVHVMGVGVDSFPIEALHDHQTLTCSRGATAVPIGEYAMTAIASHARAMPEVFLDEAPEHWYGSPRVSGLNGTTLVLVGVGGIGSHIARIALAFGMRVIGVRRRELPAPVEGMEISTDLTTAVAEADHLVIAAPATSDTDHLVNAAILAAAKPGLHLVNVARGSLVDQEALRAALDSGQVARATLDVVTPEPLPADSWMYAHPGVYLSPHVSWVGPGSNSAMGKAFIANYARFRAGETLDGIVDRALGY